MVRISLGFACNNACIFCAQGDLRRSQPASPSVRAALEAIVPGDRVAFVGGEPTLFDELPAWIREAHDRSAASIVVQTNGRRLAYRAYTRTLRDASPRVVLDVSLHGSTAPMHDYHTSVPESFQQTMMGLRNAGIERIPFGITTVVTRSNFRHLAEIVRLGHVARARAIHFAMAAPFGRGAKLKDRVVPASSMVLPYLGRAAAEARQLGLALSCSTEPRSDEANADEIDKAFAAFAESGATNATFAGLGAVEGGMVG